ncbi:MAG TPA: ATP-binding cassette domain-containing protein, partial [Gemmataceae bacterium]
MKPLPAGKASPGATPLLVFEGATFTRLGGGTALRGLSWTVREGECWAVVGPVGSGKTTLGEALLGKHPLAAGKAAWPLLDRLRAAGRPVAWPSDVLRLVTFREESRLFSYSRHYYQQRFNFIEPGDDVTLGEFLRAGASRSGEAVRGAADRLGIGDLLPLSLIKLSNGQMRRARIARALLADPELLILDDPFLGLDAAGRGEVSGLLGDLVRRGTRVLLLTRPDRVPDWVTHVLELDGGAVRRQGRRDDFGFRDEDRVPPGHANLSQGPKPEQAAPAREEAVIELRRVNVAYGDRHVLRD